MTETYEDVFEKSLDGKFSQLQNMLTKVINEKLDKITVQTGLNDREVMSNPSNPTRDNRSSVYNKTKIIPKHLSDSYCVNCDKSLIAPDESHPHVKPIKKLGKKRLKICQRCDLLNDEDSSECESCHRADKLGVLIRKDLMDITQNPEEDSEEEDSEEDSDD